MKIMKRFTLISPHVHERTDIVPYPSRNMHTEGLMQGKKGFVAIVSIFVLRLKTVKLTVKAYAA